MREARLKRRTNETDIEIFLKIDGEGLLTGKTGCGFFDHMLNSLCRHGGFDIDIKCKGDFEVDYHHTVEDVGITLGSCFFEALRDCAGITRFANASIPMDEAVVMSSIDVGGRGGYYSSVKIPTEKIGEFDTELVNEFFTAFCKNSGITLHLNSLCGTNSHHIVEAAFKAFAVALKGAVKKDERFGDRIPSTKGTLK
ncbi:MAG: imidazoleglycerol-phosphate dehydratase HisB [Ruminococcaceae bacterium]|nr:imidazoleglycerol-phosphate dehydratase HisB [Oscillospiraceae bacterium]